MSKKPQLPQSSGVQEQHGESDEALVQRLREIYDRDPRRCFKELKEALNQRQEYDGALLGQLMDKIMEGGGPLEPVLDSHGDPENSREEDTSVARSPSKSTLDCMTSPKSAKEIKQSKVSRHLSKSESEKCDGHKVGKLRRNTSEGEVVSESYKLHDSASNKANVASSSKVALNSQPTATKAVSTPTKSSSKKSSRANHDKITVSPSVFGKSHKEGKVSETDDDLTRRKPLEECGFGTTQSSKLIKEAARKNSVEYEDVMEVQDEFATQKLTQGEEVAKKSVGKRRNSSSLVSPSKKSKLPLSPAVSTREKSPVNSCADMGPTSKTEHLESPGGSQSFTGTQLGSCKKCFVLVERLSKDKPAPVVLRQKPMPKSAKSKHQRSKNCSSISSKVDHENDPLGVVFARPHPPLPKKKKSIITSRKTSIVTKEPVSHQDISVNRKNGAKASKSFKSAQQNSTCTSKPCKPTESNDLSSGISSWDFVKRKVLLDPLDKLQAENDELNYDDDDDDDVLSICAPSYYESELLPVAEVLKLDHHSVDRESVVSLGSDESQGAPSDMEIEGTMDYENSEDQQSSISNTKCVSPNLKSMPASSEEHPEERFDLPEKDIELGFPVENYVESPSICKEGRSGQITGGSQQISSETAKSRLLGTRQSPEERITRASGEVEISASVVSEHSAAESKHFDQRLPEIDTLPESTAQSLSKESIPPETERLSLIEDVRLHEKLFHFKKPLEETVMSVGNLESVPSLKEVAVPRTAPEISLSPKKINASNVEVSNARLLDEVPSSSENPVVKHNVQVEEVVSLTRERTASSKDTVATGTSDEMILSAVPLASRNFPEQPAIMPVSNSERARERELERRRRNAHHSPDSYKGVHFEPPKKKVSGPVSHSDERPFRMASDRMPPLLATPVEKRPLLSMPDSVNVMQAHPNFISDAPQKKLTEKCALLPTPSTPPSNYTRYPLPNNQSCSSSSLLNNAFLTSETCPEQQFPQMLIPQPQGNAAFLDNRSSVGAVKSHVRKDTSYSGTPHPWPSGCRSYSVVGDVDYRIKDGVGKLPAKPPLKEMTDVERLLKDSCFKFLRTGKTCVSCDKYHKFPSVKFKEIRDKTLIPKILEKLIIDFTYWMENSLEHMLDELGSQGERQMLECTCEFLWLRDCDLKKDKSASQRLESYAVHWRWVAKNICNCGSSPSQTLSLMFQRVKSVFLKHKDAQDCKFDVLDHIMNALYEEFIKNQRNLWPAVYLFATLEHYEIPVIVIKEVLKDAVQNLETKEHPQICDYLIKSHPNFVPSKPEEQEVAGLLHEFIHVLERNPENKTRASDLCKRFNISYNRNCCELILSPYEPKYSVAKTSKRFSIPEVIGRYQKVTILRNPPNLSKSVVRSTKKKEVILRDKRRQITRSSAKVNSTSEGEVTSSTEEIVCPPLNICRSDQETDLITVENNSEKYNKTKFGRRLTRQDLKSNIIAKKFGAAAGFVVKWHDPDEIWHGCDVACDALIEGMRNSKVVEIAQNYGSLLLGVLASLTGSPTKDDISRASVLRIGLLLLEELMKGDLWKEANQVLDLLHEKLKPYSDKIWEPHSLSFIKLTSAKVYLKNKKLKPALEILSENNFFALPIHWKDSRGLTGKLAVRDAHLRDEVCEAVFNECVSIDAMVNPRAENLFKEMLEAQASYSFDVGTRLYNKLLWSILRIKKPKSALELIMWAAQNYKLKPTDPNLNRVLLNEISTLSTREQIGGTLQVLLLLEERPYNEALPKSVEGVDQIIVSVQSVWSTFEIHCIVQFLLNCHISNLQLGQELPLIAVVIKETELPDSLLSDGNIPNSLKEVDPSRTAAEERIRLALSKGLPEPLYADNADFENGTLVLDRQRVQAYVEKRRASDYSAKQQISRNVTCRESSGSVLEDRPAMGSPLEKRPRSIPQFENRSSKVPQYDKRPLTGSPHDRRLSHDVMFQHRGPTSAQDQLSAVPQYVDCRSGMQAEPWGSDSGPHDQSLGLWFEDNGMGVGSRPFNGQDMLYGGPQPPFNVQDNSMLYGRQQGVFGQLGAPMQRYPHRSFMSQNYQPYSMYQQPFGPEGNFSDQDGLGSLNSQPRSWPRGSGGRGRSDLRGRPLNRRGKGHFMR